MLANDNESREITGLESQIQSLLESLLELGICTSIAAEATSALPELEA